MSVNGGNGFGGRGRRHTSALAEINVTPFVDVVLVLLVIFMLTAHVMEFGIEVDVPETRNVKETAKEMPVVTITREGEITLNGKPVNLNELATTIKQQYKTSDGVYVRADRGTVWDPIAQVTSELGAAKLQVNLVTRLQEDKGKR
ncbi:MAG TPA: biopolymer transporter ExbD [Candidatus Solibacter sp.]|nr:biopolymer transporter ExbD [Candidatus Solibacter sp.]